MYAATLVSMLRSGRDSPSLDVQAKMLAFFPLTTAPDWCHQCACAHRLLAYALFDIGAGVLPVHGLL
jgi:hypothetical protein